MPLDAAGLRSKLSELGGKPIGDFNQAAAIGTAGSGSSGACVGMCADWLRRIVQCREKQAYPNDPDKTRRALATHSALEKGAVEREQARFDKRKTDIASWTDNRKAALGTELSQLQKSHAEKQARYNRVADAFNNSRDAGPRGMLHAEMVRLGAEIDAMAERSNAIPASYNAVQDLAQAHQSKIDADRAAKSPVHRVWDDAVAIVDTTPKKRTYGGLSVVISVPMGNFRTAGHLVYAAIQSGAFSAERGALFDVAPGATGVGHTVAGFHQANSRYLLFDPNLGVYEFDAGPFMKSVAVLFTEGYVNCLDSTGGVRASYTIFGDAAQAPTVHPPMSAAAAAAAGGGSG